MPVLRYGNATRPPVSCLREAIAGINLETVGHPAVHAQLQRVVLDPAERPSHVDSRCRPHNRAIGLAGGTKTNLPVVEILVPRDSLLAIRHISDLHAQ